MLIKMPSKPPQWLMKKVVTNEYAQPIVYYYILSFKYHEQIPKT